MNITRSTEGIDDLARLRAMRSLRANATIMIFLIRPPTFPTRSRNQADKSLHLISAISFVCAYVLVFTSPVAAALAGWLAAMTTRQIGHFFFEPKGYDEVN